MLKGQGQKGRERTRRREKEMTSEGEPVKGKVKENCRIEREA
jgi:hypothetical protein